MKKTLITLCLLAGSSLAYSQVGINTQTPHPSSVLDINVTNLPINSKKGVLLPQVALASITDVKTIPNPANGLIVYNTANAGSSPNNVFANNLYRFNSSSNTWIRFLDEATPLQGTASVSTALSFLPSGNTTTFLGADLGANIRQVLFDNILFQNSRIGFYSPSTKEFTANMTGYYNFQINLTIKGPYTGSPRLGLSRPYTGAIPTSASNATFSIFTQNPVDANATDPATILCTGMLFMNAGEKIIFLTRYITPTANSLNVESINYDRRFVNSVSITYFSTTP